MFRRWILPWLVYFFYRLWVFTWRVDLEETPEIREILKSGQSLIFAHWHRDELSLVQFVPRYRIATMTSTSKDGQLIDFVIRKLGGATSKGSSTRGGAQALIGLTRLMLEEKRCASMAVDGPRGPIFKPKPGVFELSRFAGAYIAPTGVASSNRFVFEKAWNKVRLPKPFSRVVIRFGELIKIEAQDARDPSLAEYLASRSMPVAKPLNGDCTLRSQRLARRKRHLKTREPRAGRPSEKCWCFRDSSIQ